MATKKHYPVVRSSDLVPSSTPAQINSYIQIDQELSKMNRRHYRQGRYYQVKIDIDPTSTNDIEVYALRDDWALQKAYQMAYATYRDNTKEERAMLGSSVARWEDFRINHGLGANETQAYSQFYQNTALGIQVALATGEFELANVVDESGNTRTFTIGPSPGATEFGIVREYDKSFNTNATPSSPTATGPYIGLNTEINSGTLSDLQDDGNLPPYNQTSLNSDYPWVKIGEIGTGASGVQRLSTGYFTAPLGLVVLTNVGVSGEDISKVSFEVKAGDYKGVHAPSMLE